MLDVTTSRRVDDAISVSTLFPFAFSFVVKNAIIDHVSLKYFVAEEKSQKTQLAAPNNGMGTASGVKLLYKRLSPKKQSLCESVVSRKKLCTLPVFRAQSIFSKTDKLSNKGAWSCCIV